jgi:hypothetical protein
MPAPSSGASRQLSMASTASFRIADILTMMDDDPSPRSSSVTRQALTVALGKPGRGPRSPMGYSYRSTTMGST